MEYSRIMLPAVVGGLGSLMLQCDVQRHQRPNVIVVFADQWRARDLGYAGNRQVLTPNIDRLAKESVIFTNAISNIPVCTPARASLMTGQYPLTHGLFYNDKPLDSNAVCIAEVFRDEGYETGYIGKWHLNGHDRNTPVWEGRRRPVPENLRQGFSFWRVHECTHDYNHSVYFDEENREHLWEGYDAIAQTREAIQYIKANRNKTFLLFLSWGPPHEPYDNAPDEFRKLYEHVEPKLLPNVPDSLSQMTRDWLKGYYAHISALDHCIGELINAIRETGIEKNTLLVFTSDHGDMLNSHAEVKKQKPWEESLSIPFLLRYPGKLKSSKMEKVFSIPDVMPTLLGLSGIDIPGTVEGIDFSGALTGEENLAVEGGLILCPVPFHQWSYKNGGREFRGIRTEQHTFVRDLDGPWLLYDNITDPYQLDNLCGKPECRSLLDSLDSKLRAMLANHKDEFLEGKEYMRKWNYTWDMDDSLKTRQ